MGGRLSEHPRGCQLEHPRDVGGEDKVPGRSQDVSPEDGAIGEGFSMSASEATPVRCPTAHLAGPYS